MSLKTFIDRHLGVSKADIDTMLSEMGYHSLDELIDKTVPADIRLKTSLELDEPMSEESYLRHIKQLASKNKIYDSYIGMGYYDTHTPSVILRNIFENPAWYTSYTPYQAEISQGRLEALLNFQTAIIGMTKMDLANSSLLDEGTAAAEAMLMSYNLRSRQAIKAGVLKYFVDKNIFPQTLDVLRVHAEPFGIELVIDDFKTVQLSDAYFGAMVQYPAADGKIENYISFAGQANSLGIKLAVAADIMSLALLTPPGEWGADIVFGSTQRWGIPMGFGGPHAAYFATWEKYKRNVPGRIIGVTVDAHGNPALRMALQTREQHIKREKATSNICTAQALLATMAGMYAVYHGREGIEAIARSIHQRAVQLSENLRKAGIEQENEYYFDTLKVVNVDVNEIREKALAKNINLNYIDEHTIGISINETTTDADIETLFNLFTDKPFDANLNVKNAIPNKLHRMSDYLTEQVFNKYHTETEMMRYIKKLERKDISLTHSMISLGSCTMKLNAATEMLPLSWPEFGKLHPFVPLNQAEGYLELIEELGKSLLKITGFKGITFQPNSGAAGEYTGLMLIRAYHRDHGQAHRNIVLIPSSAHGTNPASSVMAGNKVVVVNCDERGNIDVDDLKAKAEQHKENLAAFMVTYPSTHGVYESRIKEMVEIVHQYGGLVYMDGANMNAQIGLTNPATIGADVCHLNLHKTFAIPHGGGGPGVGPVAVNEKLIDYLPSHSVVPINNHKKAIPAVASAPYGSAFVLPISYAYIKMAGAEGLTMSGKVAILNANFLAHKLNSVFPVLYTGETGTVAHEMILDINPLRRETGITETDIAKRLMDYGFHAPTLSFPVHGTLMVEPTESESLDELLRFVETMKSIRNEVESVKNEEWPADDNPLVNAPHPLDHVVANEWSHAYSREIAVFPLPWIRENKFFPAVARVNDAYGDRNLMCTCAPIEAYREENTLSFRELNVE